MLLNFNHNTKNTIHPSQSDMNGDYINIDSLILLILSLLCSSKLWNVAVGVQCWTQYSTLSCCIIACILIKKVKCWKCSRRFIKFFSLWSCGLITCRFYYFLKIMLAKKKEVSNNSFFSPNFVITKVDKYLWRRKAAVCSSGIKIKFQQSLIVL